MYDDAWAFLDKKSLSMMRLFLDSIVTLNISKEKATKVVMDTLVKLYKKPLASNNFFNIKMNEGS